MIMIWMDLGSFYNQTFFGFPRLTACFLPFHLCGKNRKLTRDHTLGFLRCVASNNNLTRPAETALRLKMLCKLPQTELQVSLTELCRKKGMFC